MSNEDTIKRLVQLKQEFQNTGKFYVGHDEEFNTVKFFGNTPPSNNLQLIVFPAEPQSIQPFWFATDNINGIKTVNTQYIWKTIVVRDEKARFYLVDDRNIAREVRWGHCHHAIHFYNWYEYDKALAEFENELVLYKIELNHFVQKIQNAYNPRPKAEMLNDLKSFETEWSKNIFTWIQNLHPEKTRLFLAKDRLDDAWKALSEKKKELNFKE